MIRGVAFDLEGTVVDVEAAHHEGHLRAARDAGLELSLTEALESLPHFIGGPDEEISREIWELSKKKITAEEILALDKRYYEELIKNFEIKPREGFLSLFEFFKDSNIPCSVGSLTPSNQAKTLLEQSGLTKLFGENEIILKEHVLRLKPEPDVFLLTAKRMGVPPQDQLVFEDSPNGVRAALRAGSSVIAMPVYNRPEAINALLKAGAKKMFFTWNDPELRALAAGMCNRLITQ